MASPAQIAANRANAQRSTGPRSVAGKNITRQNATTHGLCRHITLLDDDDPSEAQALLAELMAEHQPQGPTEEIIVFKMAENFFLNKRASHYLAIHTMYNEGRDADEEDETKQIALYLRYYTTTDRAFNKNLFDLRKLQKERREQQAKSGIGSVSQNVEAPPAPAQNSVAAAPPTAEKPAPVAPIDQIPAAKEFVADLDRIIGPSKSISDRSGIAD